MTSQENVRQLADRLAALRQDSQRRLEEYTAQGCADDVKLEKIRLNVVDIFQTMIGASGGEEAPDFAQRYQAKITAIPASWRARKAEAEANGDGVTAAIEAVKLETLAQVEVAFRRQFEGAGA